MFSSVTKKPNDVRKSDVDVVDTSSPMSSIKPNSTSSMNKPFGNQGMTVFSDDAELKGSLSFSSKMEFNGRFEGEIIAEGPLVIGEKALIKGDIVASSSVVIMGKVKGNISAKQQVELKEMGHLYGDVRAPKFLISEGAVFVGRSDTLDGKGPADDFNNMFNRLTGGGKKTSSLPADSAP
jgi:cytoskeletal protein CcmA (bactofilin family)